MTNSKRTTAPRNLVAERYRKILDRRGADEIRTLAQVKRFLERYVADPRFREELKQNPEAPHLVAEMIGCEARRTRSRRLGGVEGIIKEEDDEQSRG